MLKAATNKGGISKKEPSSLSKNPWKVSAIQHKRSDLVKRKENSLLKVENFVKKTDTKIREFSSPA